ASLSLDYLELEFHRFSAHYITQIVLPEAPVSREMVHQELEAEPAPEGQQAHTERRLPEAAARVVAEAGVIIAEVAEGERIQMPLVRRVAEGAEVGVMRRLDADGPARPHQAVELLHGADDVGNMLDYVNRAQVVERIIGEGIGDSIEVAEHV